MCRAFARTGFDLVHFLFLSMISGKRTTGSMLGWILPALSPVLILAAAMARSATPAVLAHLPDQAVDQTGAQTDDQTDALIQRLARPAPARIAFTEVRLSPLLKQPLIVAGELGYAGPTSLDRRVTQPYRESTAIRGESVRVEREGERPRSFALQRAPELRGLLHGFSALLSGDAAGLRRSFSITSQISSDQAWAIAMTPLDAKARRRVQQLIVVGRGNEPSCLTLTTADNGASVMLLGNAARASIPAQATVEQLAALCREEAPS